MGKFAVPREYQQSALMIGIILALVMRGIFIAVGAAAINNFSWVFYLFGAFLVLTAVNLAREGHEDEQGYDEPRLVRWVRKHLPVGEEWNGVKFSIRENGKRVLTPMAMVVITLGMTDLLFALDSIPAIYGLTEEPYLVLTANVFALMGLRQLYFLIGGLLKRLVYLSYGLAFLLLFIGVKLILHAMHENELPFVNGGEHVGWAPEIPIWLSLLVILGTLVVTAVASLASDKSQARRRGGLSDGRRASLPAGHRSDRLPRLAAGAAAARRRSPRPRADPRRGQARATHEWRDRVEVVEGDASSYDVLRRALDGVDVGYYLLHSMDGRPGFERARPGDGLDVRPCGRGRRRRPDRLHVRAAPRGGGAQRPPRLAGRGRRHLPGARGCRPRCCRPR